jgi:hypothetical protein
MRARKMPPRKMRAELRWLAGCVVVVGLLGNAARAIETTYGEDPVPDTRCYPGYLQTTYGMDPIPAESPAVRWRKWRASRGLPSGWRWHDASAPASQTAGKAARPQPSGPRVGASGASSRRVQSPR